MADPKQAAQVQAFLEGLQKERQAKLSETSGVGDLLALEKPAAALMGWALANADQGTRITDMPYYGSVVSPAVKKSRAAVLKAALENARPKPRMDAVPTKLYDYGPELERRKRLTELNVPVTERNEGFFGYEGKYNKTKNYEILKNKEPHSGLSITPPKKEPDLPPTVKVDIQRRAPLKELEDFAIERSRYDNLQKQYWQEYDKFRDRHSQLLNKGQYDEASRIMNDLEKLRAEAFNYDKFPTLPARSNTTQLDPTAIRPLARWAAAKNPEATHVGGYRVSGIRQGKAGRGSENITVPLPSLSDTQRLATLQQFEKWLHEKINTRAMPKTKTAGR